MSNVNGRKVSFLRLHSVTHVDGAGQLATNIGLKDNKYIDFSMIKIEGGVFIKGGGVRGDGSAAGMKGRPFEVFIPDAACQSIQFVID